MSESVIVALITGICAVIGQWIIAHNQHEKDEYERGQRDKALDDQLKNLTTKVDEHNGYAKKFADLSTDIKLMAQDIKYLKEGIFNENSK